MKKDKLQRNYGAFNLDMPKIGDLMLVKHQNKGLTKGYFGRKIKQYQKSQGFSESDSSWTHVELLLGGPNSVRIQPPRNIVLDGNQHPTMPEFYKGKTVRIIRFNCPDWNYKRYRVAIWYACKANLKYDKLGILRFYLDGLVDHSESQFFCSEGAIDSLRREYPLLCPVLRTSLDPHEFLPADFSLKNWSYQTDKKRFIDLETIFEGVLT